jgi:RND family efflux transporter MFP subunit
MASVSRCFLISLTALAVLTGCEEEAVVSVAKPRPVVAAEVGAQAGFYGRWFPGRARAAQEVELAFNVGGPVLSLPVRVGDAVEAGQLLSSVDPAPFQAEVDRQKANLARAEATLVNAEQDLGRDQILFEQEHIAQARLDTTIAHQRAALADVAAYQAALRKSRLDLEDCYLRAPFAGTVVAVYVDEFQTIRLSERILRVVDPAQIEMIVDIPESMIALAPKARNIVVIFDNFEEIIFPAEIKEVGTEASQTTRTYPVTLLLDQINEVTILPGMTGRASGERDTDDVDSALVVPVSATFSPEDLDTTFVWVIGEDDMTVTRREVSVGPVSDQGIELLSGVEKGEWVATAGVHYLVEGQEVRILEH